MKDFIFLAILGTFFCSCSKESIIQNQALFFECRDGYEIALNLDPCNDFEDPQWSSQGKDGMHYYSPLVIPNKPNQIVYSSAYFKDGETDTFSFKLIDLCDKNKQVKYLNIDIGQFNNDYSPQWINSNQFIYYRGNEIRLQDIKNLNNSNFPNEMHDILYMVVDTVKERIYASGKANGEFDNYILDYNGEIIGTLPIGYHQIFTKYIVHNENLLGIHKVVDDEFNEKYYFAILDFEKEELLILKEIPVFWNNEQSSAPKYLVRYNKDEVIYSCRDGLYKYNIVNNVISPIVETHCDLTYLGWLQYHESYKNYCFVKGGFGYHAETPPPNTNLIYLETYIQIINIETGEKWKSEGLP
jgi:hypothetical protein